MAKMIAQNFYEKIDEALLSHVVSASLLSKNLVLMDIYQSLSCFTWNKSIKTTVCAEIMGTN